MTASGTDLSDLVVEAEPPPSWLGSMLRQLADDDRHSHAELVENLVGCRLGDSPTSTLPPNVKLPAATHTRAATSADWYVDNAEKDDDSTAEPERGCNLNAEPPSCLDRVVCIPQ